MDSDRTQRIERKVLLPNFHTSNEPDVRAEITRLYQAGCGPELTRLAEIIKEERIP